MLYFPTPYDDELTGSLLIRACRHLGLSMTKLTHILLGRRRSYMSFMFLANLPQLARAADLDAEELLWKHTQFPFLVAFRPRPYVDKLRKEIMHGDGCRHHLGALTQAATEGVTFPRYCRSCAQEMDSRHGETWWKREHNLPAAHLCLVHSCHLVDSATRIDHRSYDLPADAKGGYVRFRTPDEVLLRLAYESISLLRCGNHENLGWATDYRNKAREKGYASLTGDLSGYELSRDLRKYFGTKLLNLANVPIHLENDRPWPSMMVRRRPGIPFAPVKHVLLNEFLQHCVQATPEYRPDYEADDDAYASRLQIIIDSISSNNRKYRVSEVLTKAGCWGQYQYHRQRYPKTTAILRFFKSSNHAIYRTSGTE